MKLAGGAADAALYAAKLLGRNFKCIQPVLKSLNREHKLKSNGSKLNNLSDINL